MLDFVKKNLAWIAISFCIIGVILSIVGIPTQQPICFFIGIVFALPTVAYLIYQVFFDKDTPELNFQTVGNKHLTGNVTTIVDRRENLILMNDEEDDLEPLYNGFATQQEIENQLAEIIKEERNKAIASTPAQVVTADTPEITATTAIKTTTEGELLRQRQLNHHEKPNNVARIKKAQAKKTILTQENLEQYLQHYFIEVAACFMLDRNLYKDARGIAPYNKLAINKTTGLPEFSMSNTRGKFYKFCSYLPDVERFIEHPDLYIDFTNSLEKGMPLGRISETMHALYRRKYKKDFILNLSHREDWDNIIILVFNNYILDNDNFKDVFTRVPFEIPAAYNDQNVTDYLCDLDVQEKFLEKFPTYTDIGIPTAWEAMYVCFINSIKEKLSAKQLENAILKDYKKIARALKRTDNARRLRRAS